MTHANLTPHPSATLRTVTLPDCCGNCKRWTMRAFCDFTMGRDTYERDWLRVEFNNVCDLHERKAGT